MASIGRGDPRARGILGVETTRRRRLLVALAVLVPSLLVGDLMAGPRVAPALADESSGTSVPETVRRWGIAPTAGTAEQPAERPFFAYELAPGASLRDSVTVWNPGDEPLTLRAYAQDAINGPSGALDLRTAEQTPTDVGAWVQLDNEQVVVPPRSGVPIPFTLTVPPKTEPGDHTGGIVAVLAARGDDQGGRSVVVDHRVGARVYVRVSGPLSPSLVVDRLDTDYRGSLDPRTGGDLAVTYTIRNAGNVRMAGSQVLRVLGPLGWSLQERTLDDLPELLPGSSYTRTEIFTAVPAVGRVTGELEVAPRPAALDPTSAAAPVVRATSSWAIPWLLLALLVVVGGLLVVRRRVRRRPDRAETASSGSTASPEAVDVVATPTP